MVLTALGIDLAKNVFQLHGVDGRGKAILRKKVSRGQLLAFVANLPACRIGMEACGSANYWAREFKKFEALHVSAEAPAHRSAPDGMDQY